MIKIFSIFTALLLCTNANAQLFQVHRMIGSVIPARNIHQGMQNKPSSPPQRNNGSIPPRPR